MTNAVDLKQWNDDDDDDDDDDDSTSTKTPSRSQYTAVDKEGKCVFEKAAKEMRSFFVKLVFSGSTFVREICGVWWWRLRWCWRWWNRFRLSTLSAPAKQIWMKMEKNWRWMDWDENEWRRTTELLFNQRKTLINNDKVPHPQHPSLKLKHVMLFPI